MNPKQVLLGQTQDGAIFQAQKDLAFLDTRDRDTRMP